MNLPPPILSNEKGSFPWRVLAERHPALIEQVRTATPYGPDQHQRLDDLTRIIIDGVIEPFDGDLDGASRWNDWAAPYLGQTWFDVPFLIAENLFYRRLLEAVGYFTPGPWQGVDPFWPAKNEELRTMDVAGIASVAAEPVERAQRALLASVWGNQADLGFRLTADLDAQSAGHSVAEMAEMAETAEMARESRLVADDSHRLWDRLAATSGVAVLVTDNAGRELTADLLLADHLLTAGLAGQVRLHVKPSPYFVSDAMTADVIAVIGAMAVSGPAGAAAAHRLKAAAREDKLAIATHWFYCSPLTYHDLPGDLADEFAAASAVLLKGDLNYRRLVGDFHWDPEAEFASAAGYFPGWVAALRTLKSDVIAGLDRATLERLDATGEPWRTSGSYALIQAAG